jgi:hypothetical protein
MSAPCDVCNIVITEVTTRGGKLQFTVQEHGDICGMLLFTGQKCTNGLMAAACVQQQVAWPLLVGQLNNWYLLSAGTAAALRKASTFSFQYKPPQLVPGNCKYADAALVNSALCTSELSAPTNTDPCNNASCSYAVAADAQTPPQLNVVALRGQEHVHRTSTSASVIFRCCTPAGTLRLSGWLCTVTILQASQSGLSHQPRKALTDCQEVDIHRPRTRTATKVHVQLMFRLRTSRRSHPHHKPASTTK